MKAFNYALNESFQLCFKSSKIMTITYLFIKLLITCLPSLQIIYLSNLITIIENSTGRIDSSFRLNLFLLVMVIMLTWISKSSQLLILECLKIKIKEKMAPLPTKKRTHLCLESLEDEKTNEMIHRVSSEIEVNICNTFESTFGLMLFVVQIFFILLILMKQVWWISILILIISLPLIPITINNSRNKYEQDMKVTKVRRQYEYLSECITNKRDALERELFNTNQSLCNQWVEKYTTARIIKNDNEKKWYKKVQSASFVTQVFFLLIIIILAIYTREGYLSMGIFIAFLPTSFDLVLIASWDLHDYINKAVIGKEYFSEYKIFMGLKEYNNQGKITVDSIEEIEFCRVSFKYPNSDREVISNFSYIFKNKCNYFLIGLNGAGKSTLVKLVLGFYQPNQGSILINGINLNKINLDCVYENSSVMFQDFVKFNLTAKASLGLGNHGIDYGFVDEIYDDSFLKEALKSEKPIGKEYSDGIGLSGGEWQKVSIYRIINKRCNFKVFDEPTAFIDPIEESKFMKSMKLSCSLGIFITHRLSLIDALDQVLVISEGNLIEYGTKEQLLKNDSYFKKLYKTQGSWYQ